MQHAKKRSKQGNENTPSDDAQANENTLKDHAKENKKVFYICFDFFFLYSFYELLFVKIFQWCLLDVLIHILYLVGQ